MRTFLALPILFSGLCILLCGGMIQKNLYTSSHPITYSKFTSEYGNDWHYSQDYCSLTFEKTFDYLVSNSPFNLGSGGSVNFTKRFDYQRNAWVEGEVNISGGLGSNSRLSGQYRVTAGNMLKISELRATSGIYDASRNGDTYGSFTINCDGNIVGYLRDSNGNTKDITFEKK